MAKFCSNCGSPMEDGDKVCGQCGTPVRVEETTSSTAPTVEKKDEKNNTTKIVKIVVVLIVLIVLGVIAANVASRFTGYNGTLRKFVKALQEDDVDALDSLSSSISEDIYSSWYGKDYFKYYEKSVDETLDTFEDKVGNIKKISYEVVDITELSDRRVNSIGDRLVDLYNSDVSEITAITRLDIKLTVKGNRKSAAYNVDELYLIKEAGKWKIYYGNLDY